MRYCAHPVRFCSFLSLGSCWFCRGGAASGEGAKTDPHGFAARSCALHPLSRLDRYTGYSFLQRKENRGACKKSSHYRRQARRDGCFNRLGIEEGLRKKKKPKRGCRVLIAQHTLRLLKQAVSVYTAVSLVTLLHKRTAAFRSVGHALGQLYSLKSYVVNFHAQMSSIQSNERTTFFKRKKNSCPMQSHRARWLSFAPIS